jgi:hypothetical protein
MTNNSGSALAVTDAALVRSAAHLHPIGRGAMGLLIADGDKHAPSAIAGRILIGTSAAVNVASVTKSLSIPVGLSTALAFAISYGPNAVTWFKGVEVPVLQNFSALSPPTVIEMQPGASALVYLFTERWDWTAAPQEFAIQVMMAPNVKLVAQ